MRSFSTRVFGCIALLALILFASCEKEMDKYYEIPDWLKGNAWELLESRGNFTHFLEAVDMAGFRDVISGKGIITVMAPTDEAFEQYLGKKGVQSVSDLPVDELKKLIGLHLVYYAFDRNKLVNYRPEGISSQQESYDDAGLYYKFRTKSNSLPEEYTDNTLPDDVNERVKKVYHKELFLPVFSYQLFDTKQIDAASNYQYFYPSTVWDGDGDGFCVSNANVGEYELVTDNGYVYLLNQVLEPLETIHKQLESDPDFSTFKNLYDKFSDFQYNDNLTVNYGNGEELYLYYHVDLPKIASEWSYNGESSLPDYADLAKLSRLANNVFAPDNNAIQDFFNTFWSDFYSDIYEVQFLPVKYLLDNHVYEGDIVFPEEIEAGKITSKYGTVIDFNTQEVSLKSICANGTLYGLNGLSVPKMFEAITAPAFQNPDYRMFLHMIDQSDMVQPLMSDNVDFLLFLPTDSILEGNTTIYGRRLMYQNLNSNKYGQQNIMIEGADEPWVYMKTSLMEGVVKNHVATRLMTTVGNAKIYKTLNTYQYLLVEDDNKVWSSFIFNNYPDQPMPFVLNSERYNGQVFDLKGVEEKALIQDYNLFKEQVTKNPLPGQEYFKQMVGAAQFNTTTPPFNFMQGERFIAFVPTNKIIEDSIHEIPMIPAEMADYLKYYFVKVGASGLNDYPFPGAGIEGELVTFKPDGNSYATITLVDKGDHLELVDGRGRVVKITCVFPNIYNDGASYTIDGLLANE
ncbi:MAG: fasciclin domain-containing protein [Prolixibacteraceae bacterium]|nr:fasciclin domain-containing protein [Prolixibacteraceae bacterium]